MRKQWVVPVFCTIWLKIKDFSFDFSLNTRLIFYIIYLYLFVSIWDFSLDNKSWTVIFSA